MRKNAVERGNDDGSDTADLMSCFTKKQVNNPKFPNLSSEVSRLKNTEGGLNAVCMVMQKYENIARNEGMQQGMTASILNLMSSMQISQEKAMELLMIPKDDFSKYSQLLKS